MIDIFYYLDDSFNPKLWYQVLSAIDELHPYFVKLYRKKAEDAKTRVFEHAITHYKPSKGNLKAYLKKLAVSVKYAKGKEALILDDENYIDLVESGARRFQNEVYGTVFDNMEELVDSRLEVSDRERFDRVAQYALSNMMYFILYVKSFIDSDTTSNYFSNEFKNETVKLFHKYGQDFHPLCISIYNKHRKGFLEFMSDECVGDRYVQLDMVSIRNATSRRIILVEEDGVTQCLDPDKSNWQYRGSLNGRRILKVPYKALFDQLCDLIDEDGCNAIKYSLGDSYVIRSLGGSLSLVNISLFAAYDILKQEIITNVLKDFNGRLLGVGSECIYILQAPVRDVGFRYPSKRVIRGIEIDFQGIDVTPCDSIEE